MKEEYDFTHAERGKFFRPDARLDIPIYLDDDVSTYLSARATSKGIDLASLVNELLRRDIALLEVVE